MKNVLLVSIGLLTYPFIAATQQVDWIQSIHYSKSTVAGGEAKDNNGNIYIAGEFGGSSNSEGHGVFIAKYSSSGNLLWADSSGATFSAGNAGVVTDAGNNAYIAVYIGGQTASITFGNTVYPGSNKMYIVKYSSSGQIVWVKQVNAMTPKAMEMDNQGFLYITGLVGSAGFVSKYDTSGNWIMGFTTGKCYDISLDGSGNIYTSQYGAVRKNSPSGSLLWTYITSHTGKIAVDALGNCYWTHGPYQGQETLIKINPSGQHVWTVNSYNGANGSAVYADNNGNIYTAGRYDDYYGSGWVGMGIAKYDSSGNQLWYYLQNNPSNNTFLYEPTDIIAKNGEVYVCGYKQKQLADGFLLKLTEPQATTVNEIKIGASLIVSPNPSNNIFSFIYKNTEANCPLSLKVFDINGKCVYKKSIREFNGELCESIDLSAFSKGTYTLEVITGKHREIKKLALQ